MRLFCARDRKEEKFLKDLNMREKKYYTKVQFDECWGYRSGLRSRLVLNIHLKELTYQTYKGSQEESVCESIGIKLTDEDIGKVLPYCETDNFEPFRNRAMNFDDIGRIGYRDEVSMYLTAISDSYVPMIALPMDYYYDEEHIWPSEKLYRYLVLTFFDNKGEENNKIYCNKGKKKRYKKKVCRVGPCYGGNSLFI